MAAGRRVAAPRRVSPRTASGPAIVRRTFARDLARRTRALEHLASASTLSVDDVHQLRVGTRRLRSSLSVIRHAGGHARIRRTRRELRALGRVLGTCRALDIALRDAGKYGADTAPLEKRRARAGAVLRRELKPRRIRAVVADLRHVQGALGDVSFERLPPWLESLEWEMAYRLASPPRTAAARHELRIQLKMARYVIESLGRRSTALQKLQDALGREHDLAVLRSLAGRIPRAVRDERMARKRAERLLAPALNSAMRTLRALRRDLRV